MNNLNSHHLSLCRSFNIAKYTNSPCCCWFNMVIFQVLEIMVAGCLWRHMSKYDIIQFVRARSLTWVYPSSWGVILIWVHIKLNVQLYMLHIYISLDFYAKFGIHKIQLSNHEKQMNPYSMCSNPGNVWSDNKL